MIKLISLKEQLVNLGYVGVSQMDCPEEGQKVVVSEDIKLASGITVVTGTEGVISAVAQDGSTFAWLLTVQLEHGISIESPHRYFCYPPKEEDQDTVLPTIVLKSFEFDNYPGQKGTVDIVTEGNYNSIRIVLKLNDKEEVLIDALMDQWGVYLNTNTTTVAQEDQTRSFLHALTMCIAHLKEMTEFETKDSDAIKE